MFFVLPNSLGNFDAHARVSHLGMWSRVGLPEASSSARSYVGFPNQDSIARNIRMHDGDPHI